MHQRVGWANIALDSTLAGGEPRELVSLPVGLSAFIPCPAVHHPMMRRLRKSCDLEGLGSVLSDPPKSQHTHTEPGYRTWRLSAATVMGSVNSVLFLWCLPGNETCSFPGRAWSPTIVPFTVRTSCCWNYSAGSHQILSWLPLCGYFPPRHSSRVLQVSLICDGSLFSSSDNISINTPSLKI
jgi:hypothetical protein